MESVGQGQGNKKMTRAFENNTAANREHAAVAPPSFSARINNVAWLYNVERQINIKDQRRSNEGLRYLRHVLATSGQSRETMSLGVVLTLRPVPVGGAGVALATKSDCHGPARLQAHPGQHPFKEKVAFTAKMSDSARERER